jgi:hypothetical protein
MSILKQAVSTASGNATGVASASAVSGNAVFMGQTALRVTDLSALIAVTANTSGLTFAPRWQVSADNSTWYSCKADPDNANAVLATGASGGGNVTGSVPLPAPSFVKGWKYARAQVVVGGTTGTTNDLYSISYNYRFHRRGKDL